MLFGFLLTPASLLAIEERDAASTPTGSVVVRDLRAVELKNKISTTTQVKDRLEIIKSGTATGSEATIRNRIQTIKDRASTTRENVLERKAKLSAERQAIIRAFFDRMIKRIAVAFNRMDRLVGRLESRIAKLEEVNKNIKTEEAKGFITEAKTHIANGKAILLGLPAIRDTLLATTDSHKDVFEKIKEETRKETGELKKAHEAIKNAVRSIKANGGSSSGDNDDNGNTATSTATTTTSN